jgi:N-methylhydantoinase A/oxoprolinase/acetone carboxylase beta subunit
MTSIEKIRIGVDVGGTNTDAVAMRGREVLHAVKATTTEDVMGGVLEALRRLLREGGIAPASVGVVMIGTTHFTNAVVQRREVEATAAVRLGLPATECLPPMVDWPADLRDAIGNHWFLAHGGCEYDGRDLSPLDPAELAGIGAEILRRGIRAIAVTSVFSPVSDAMEIEAARILAEAVPGARITRSAEIGRIGLLERENAAIMNACLSTLSRKTVGAFRDALRASGLGCPFYLTQNDGTLMSADTAERFPVLTFASGPTNSMRGAAFLSGASEAIVVDVGGTTSDVGALHKGFPRQASVAVEVGEVRTNFRMPDVFSMGLGGGSLVSAEGNAVGPTSVGFRLVEQALCFGGTTLTATDIAVAAGRADIGDRARVAHLSPDFLARAQATMTKKLTDAVERMRLTPDLVPVLVVGGGGILVPEKLGELDVVRPPHHAVANAIGAAIAQVSGEVDRVFALAGTSREAALAQARQEAIDRAIAAGAIPGSVEIVDVEDVPLAYLPGNASRIRVKAVGDLDV